jgi:hypothetical protein
VASVTVITETLPQAASAAPKPTKYFHLRLTEQGAAVLKSILSNYRPNYEAAHNKKTHNELTRAVDSFPFIRVDGGILEDE